MLDEGRLLPSFRPPSSLDLLRVKMDGIKENQSLLHSLTAACIRNHCIREKKKKWEEGDWEGGESGREEVGKKCC